jgi:hypothetical protein
MMSECRAWTVSLGSSDSEAAEALRNLIETVTGHFGELSATAVFDECLGSGPTH